MPKGGNNNGGGKPGGGDGGINQINGNKRDNYIVGTDGEDIVFAKGGDDTVYGRDGNDRLIGGEGNDSLYGEMGDDSLHGSDGDDLLDGGEGSDWLQGGDGSDVLDGGADADGDDHDVAAFLEAATYDADTGTYLGLTIEYVDSTDYDPSVSGYTATNALGETDEVVRVEEVIGSNADDVMIGGGDDTYSHDDYLVGARGEDVISGGSGDDTLYGSLDDDVIDAGENGGSGSDTLIFLRYNTNGNDIDDDPYALGDGHDVVWGFDVTSDSILFLGNEAVPFTLSAADGGASTLISYATNSTILLKDVDFVSESGSIVFDPWEYVDV